MSAEHKGSKPGLFESTSASTTTPESPPKYPITDPWRPSGLPESASQDYPQDQHATDESLGQKNEGHQSSSESNVSIDGHNGGLPQVSRTKSRASVAPDGTFYPEGGLRAWLVVFGSFCGLLAALGLMNTVGVYQGRQYTKRWQYVRIPKLTLHHRSLPRREPTVPVQ